MKKYYDYELGEGDNTKCYEVEVCGYSSYQRATRDSPAEGGEIEIGGDVKVVDDDGHKYEIPYDTFIQLYADEYGQDIKWAQRHLEDDLYEKVVEDIQAMRDDEGDNWRDE